MHKDVLHKSVLGCTSVGDPEPVHSDPLLGHHKHCFHSSNINMDPDPNPIRFGR